MFDRVSVSLLPIGLAIAMSISASLAPASVGKAYAADPVAATEPSIQYQEALAHSTKTYSFAPGGAVTVPFRPRAGDSAKVDGAAPVALPAAKGSGAVTPKLAAPASVTPNATLNVLRRQVFGFLPYWQLGSTLNYDTLSTIAYFGILLNVDMAGNDPNNDGALYRSDSGWNGWNSSSMTAVINNAHAHRTRVVLTGESFAWESG